MTLSSTGRPNRPPPSGRAHAGWRTDIAPTRAACGAGTSGHRKPAAHACTVACREERLPAARGCTASAAVTVRYALAMIGRRRFLEALAALGVSQTLPSRATDRKVSFDSYPFTLGVASGYPSPSGVVLWTRSMGLDPLELPVRWEGAA